MKIRLLYFLTCALVAQSITAAQMDFAARERQLKREIVVAKTLCGHSNALFGELSARITLVASPVSIIGLATTNTSLVAVGFALPAFSACLYAGFACKYGAEQGMAEYRLQKLRESRQLVASQPQAAQIAQAPLTQVIIQQPREIVIVQPLSPDEGFASQERIS